MTPWIHAVDCLTCLKAHVGIWEKDKFTPLLICLSDCRSVRLSLSLSLSLCVRLLGEKTTQIKVEISTCINVTLVKSSGTVSFLS